MRSIGSLSWRKSLPLWQDYPPANALLGTSGTLLKQLIYVWYFMNNVLFLRHGYYRKLHGENHGGRGTFFCVTVTSFKFHFFLVYLEWQNEHILIIILTFSVFRLNSSDQDGEPMYIQMVTALVLQLIQCVVHLPSDKDVFEEYDNKVRGSL